MRNCWKSVEHTTCTLGSEGKYKYTPGKFTCYHHDYNNSIQVITITMVLKLHGIYRSPFVRLVAAVLVEKQVPFELVSVKDVSVDFTKGEHKSPEYLEKQPFGQVPYIVCDSLKLFFCQLIQ